MSCRLKKVLFIMKLDSGIGERLRIARKKAGDRPARAFANTHKIPYVTYSQHETGNRRLSPDAILKYAEMLNTSAAWLLTGLEEHRPDILMQTEENVIDNNTETSLNATNSSHTNHFVSYLNIDADFLGEVFNEINKMLNELSMQLSDKDKMILSIELYNALSTGTTLPIKKNNLKMLINSIKKLKFKHVA